MLETDLAGNNPTEFVFFNGSRVARRDPSGAVYYFFSDHLGSSRVVTNATGAIVEESDFYPFGGERVVVSSSGNNYKFTRSTRPLVRARSGQAGHERDSESGLDNMKARHFASSLARFPQPDSFAFSSLTNPQSLNLYAYVLNNPLLYIDPTGHEASSGCGSWSPCGYSNANGQLPAHSTERTVWDADWFFLSTAMMWDGVNNESEGNTVTSEQVQDAVTPESEDLPSRDDGPTRLCCKPPDHGNEKWVIAQASGKHGKLPPEADPKARYYKGATRQVRPTPNLKLRPVPDPSQNPVLPESKWGRLYRLLGEGLEIIGGQASRGIIPFVIITPEALQRYMNPGCSDAPPGVCGPA
jgi:RHS repeat-associated protein